MRGRERYKELTGYEKRLPAKFELDLDEEEEAQAKFELASNEGKPQHLIMRR